MAAIHSSSTKPELRLRKAIWRLGFRYRINDKGLPGRPDIVLPKYRTAIFVHGCFWHAHKGCKSYNTPQSNSAFWTAKITRNQERDQEVWRKLEAKGWYVIIVWECELKRAVFEETVGRVRNEILRNGESYRSVQEERRRSRKVWHQTMKDRREKEMALMEEIRRMDF